jgi:hypothetical protein
MNNEQTSKLVLFLDPIGRNILGEELENAADNTTISVKNPVILHVADSGGGKMSVQLLPLFFREFLADKSADVVFSYQKDKIVKTDIDAFDFRLQAQYNQIFSKQSVFVSPQGQPEQQTQQPSNSVINLFDE